MKKVFLPLMLLSFFSFVFFSCDNKGKEDLLPQKYIDGLKNELNNYSNAIKDNPKNINAYIEKH